MVLGMATIEDIQQAMKNNIKEDIVKHGKDYENIEHRLYRLE